MSLNTVLMDSKLMLSLVDEMSYKIPQGSYYEMVACGRGALILLDELPQMTTDIDVFFLYADDMPTELYNAVVETARNYSELGEDWLNDNVTRWVDDNQPRITIDDFKNYFMTNDIGPLYFPLDKNEIPTIAIFGVDYFGIVAAKALANRTKDQESLPGILSCRGIYSSHMLDNLYYNKYPHFVKHPYYDQIIQNIYDIIG